MMEKRNIIEAGRTPDPRDEDREELVKQATLFSVERRKKPDDNLETDDGA